MKKFQLKNWHKAIIGCTAGVLVTTAVVVPTALVTSCSKAKKYLDDVDRQYGISSATYDSMKEQFKTVYRKKLEKQWLPKKQINFKMQFLEKDLKQFDDTIVQSEQIVNKASSFAEAQASPAYVNYTTLTSSLIEHADTQYDVSLSRTSTATWQDLQDQYDGYRDANEIYMRHQPGRFPTPVIKSILEAADRKWKVAKKQLQDKYHDDALSGLTYGLPKLIAIFEETNLDISALAASNTLHEVFDKFTFVPKEYEDGDYTNRYDKVLPELEAILATESKEIDVNTMKKLFSCVEKKTGNIYEYDPEEWIPSYTLTPRLHEIIKDEYRNDYKISIDWTIINITIAQSSDYTPEEKELATAHVYRENRAAAEGELPEDTSVAEALHGCEKEYLEYSLYPTPQFEAQQIGEWYFNPSNPDGYIRLKWNDNAKSEDNKYEQFFTGIKDKESTGTLDFKTLGASGLLISDNGKYFSKVTDLIKKVGDEAENVDEDTLTLAEQFVRYCDVKSAVKIEDPKKHYVTNTFSICYKNSVNSTCSERDARYYRGLTPFENNGYLVSPEFFEYANKSYDYAKRWVDVYRHNTFKDIYNEADGYLVSIIVTSVKTALYTAFYTFCLLCPIPVAGVPKPNYACAIALCLAEAILLATWIALTVTKIMNPIKAVAERNEEFTKEAKFKALLDKIDKDSGYFSPLDDNGNPKNKSNYDTAYQTFASADFEDETRPLYQFYTNFHRQQLTEDFVALVHDYDLESDDVDEILNPLLLPTGWLDIYSGIYIATEFAFSFFLAPTLHEWDWSHLWLSICGKASEFVVSRTISVILKIVTKTIKYFVTGYYN